MGNKILTIVIACAIAMLVARAKAYADSLPIYDIESACSADVIQSETTKAKDDTALNSREMKLNACVAVEQ